MKKCLITFLVAFTALAQMCYSADLIVNESGTTGTYSTLSAALAAADTGDRILIDPYLEVDGDTLSFSISIQSLVPDNQVSVTSPIYIIPIANQQIELIGLSALSISTITTGANATASSPAVVNVVDCELGSISLTNAFIRSNILFSEVSDNAYISNGNVVGSDIHTLYFGGGSYRLPGTDYVIANKIGLIDGAVKSMQLDGINSSSDTIYFFNNRFAGEAKIMGGYTSYNAGHIYSSVIEFRNNTFIGNGVADYAECIGFRSLNSNNNVPDYYNCSLVNNIFIRLQPSTTAVGNSSNNFSAFGAASVRSSLMFGPSYVHAFKNINNSSTEYVTTSAVGAVDYETGKLLDTSLMDQGVSSSDFVDIDLTRNDYGTFGGPYSWDNYWGGSSSGRARVYNLFLPSSIWPGQNINIKALGVHKN